MTFDQARLEKLLDDFHEASTTIGAGEVRSLETMTYEEAEAAVTAARQAIIEYVNECFYERPDPF